jgi:hypothetical protein
MNGVMSFRLLTACSLVFCVVTAGCNRSGLNLAYVDGVVTYNGQPVEHAGVLFKPDVGPFAMGTTDAQGKFTLVTANQPGALIGEHKVGISKTETMATNVQGSRFPRYDVKHAVPAKYASPTTSELSATVSNDKSKNHFTFELKGHNGGS